MYLNHTSVMDRNVEILDEKQNGQINLSAL